MGLLPASELAAVPVGHAERLPVGDREAFLAIPEPGQRPARSDRPQDEDLLARISAFADLVAAEYDGDEDGDEDNGWDGRRGRYGWSEEEPTSGWVGDADDLFAAAGELFSDRADGGRARRL